MLNTVCDSNSLVMKFKLYKFVVVTVILYGSKIQTWLTEMERKIQTFETKCFKILLQISYKEHKTNEFLCNMVAGLVGPQERLLATVRW